VIDASNDDDPEYRIAYDVDRRKVGCILIQAALCCDVPRDLFFNYFGTGDAWTVDACGCKVYPVRRAQLPLLAAHTNFDRNDLVNEKLADRGRTEHDP
jgi:hypothetical protein